VKHAVQASAAVVAFGGGLVSACEGSTASFVVDGKGQSGALAARVEGECLPCFVALRQCDNYNLK